ncbi:hypothetical protein [Streptomyces katsurahamanus]|uniref:Lipoprotein n=1 Tax=Streptomyces katsurahamanus TaxID=2577098 RepID=A0ABW9NV80_9ACTN|nr:hypothetical protein [Streptomyces katsurahamanus]MQS37212.1 hypothetical protein [Streptomyces katsurahamanus]
MSASLRPSARRAAAVALTVALGAAGCGQGSEPSKDGKGGGGGGASASAGAEKGPEARAVAHRLVDGFRSVKAAPSLTIEVSGLNEGDAFTGRIRADDRNECVGTVHIAGEGTLKAIRTRDNRVYLQMGEDFLKTQMAGEPAAELKAQMELFQDRWIAGNTDTKMFRDVFNGCDFAKGLPEMTHDEVGGTEFGAPDIETVVLNGRKALRITKKEDGATLRLHVTAEGKAYLLRMEQKGGDEPYSMTFSDFGEPVRAEKPPAGDIIPREEFARGGAPGTAGTPSTA